MYVNGAGSSLAVNTANLIGNRHTCVPFLMSRYHKHTNVWPYNRWLYIA